MPKSDEIWQQRLGDSLLSTWVNAMRDYFKIFTDVEDELNEARQNGVKSYLEEVNGIRLYSLRDVKRLPMPQEKVCKKIVDEFNKAVECQIKFRKVGQFLRRSIIRCNLIGNALY